MPFDPVDPRQSFPDLEKGILQYWKEEDMFHRSIELRKGRETFSFYDGPPFATGLPHYGHLLGGTIKDVIPRYQTMRGKKVQRRFGWDCHGLPVENLIEKEHDIKSKQDIEAMGVRRFNDLCRSSVLRYTKEWRTTVERMGRWVDMDWDYRTMDATFMESIWWVFKSLHDKKLIYEGHKPMHVCPRCVTPLSNFEVTQGYKDITDQSAVVKFELTDEPGTYILAWTTTPWTLPGNLFTAVGADVPYVKISFEGKNYIVAEARAETIFANKEFAQVGKPFKGETLKGKTYVPLFDYFVNDYKGTAFKVVTGEFVSTEDGTGIVHIAPGFGEDDFNVGKEQKVPLLQHVSMEGKFVAAVTDFAGQDVKPIDDPAKTDRKVVEFLSKQNKVFASESYRHSYPHCWRCDSPLLNYATSSWFVNVEKIKKDMLNANAKTEWVPGHLRDGRFGNWLENARDWAISRNRYWGTPLPIWRNKESGDMDVVGSRDELMSRNLMRFGKFTAVRHGEAGHNVGRFYNSEAPGVDLTDNGKKQAEAAGEFLSSQKVDIIYCSPLARTIQTAQAIADKTGAKVIIDERLREVGSGEHERKSFDFSDYALMALKRQQKMQAQSPDSPYHLEGMEKWTDVYKRIEEFLSETVPKHRSEHVVIVTHGDPIMAVRHFFTREDPFKLSHQPMAVYATPESYFWDYATNVQMDLHKENVDEVVWASNDTKHGLEITFVRHGQTEGNKNDICQGTEGGLTDLGGEQALETAKKLKKQTFDCIITSDLERARETAGIISKETGVPVVEETELLRERAFGEWIGQKLDDLLKKHPHLVEDGEFAMHHASPKDAETLSQFMARVAKAHEHLLKNYHGKKILVVAHGGVLCALQTFVFNKPYKEGVASVMENGETLKLSLNPLIKRIPDVLDCWFESGSMPYAQQHYPFEMAHAKKDTPPGYPADFIAEGIDQTRGWFYTLTVLSSALYKEPAFINCVVNGIVLAEDGRKMSKRLKNYPEPTEVADKYGADALRFALMNSPAVRGEDLRFSEKSVEETLRSVLLPLWNSYSFFVTYANLAKFEPVAKPSQSNHPLDRWIRAEVQDLVNRMTGQMDAYDLSATCGELFETIDMLTNWYIRLSRRRFAGKGASDTVEAEPENFEQERHDALTTLYDVLITVSQLLAPFCPFVTDAIYLNLVAEKHGSVHLTDWPQTRKLSKEEDSLIRSNRLLRSIVSLGMKVRADKKVKVRTPLSKATIAFPPSLMSRAFNDEEITLLRQELNVKSIVFTDNPGSLGERFVQVDARKVGPRLGKRVQEIIQAGKRGEFEEQPDGTILILDETLAPDEAVVMYRGAEGQDIATEKGVVVSLDTVVTEELRLEGLARDLIRAIQKLRKEQGYDLGEKVTIGLDGSADAILKLHKALIEQETSVIIGEAKGDGHAAQIGDESITIFIQPKA
jgi:isoleucyl-tRNA synthetase/bisphosphoglycerate-dependent phosphoglycerate mutase